VKTRLPVASKLVCCAVFFFWVVQPHQTPAAQQDDNTTEGWTAPSQDTIPKGPLGDSIRLGRLIFTETPKYASAYVGNQLSCSNCHLGAGTVAFAAPIVGLPALFPMFSQRANRVITFAERLQECFVRSENGKPLPYDSQEMTALIAYIQWLSQGQPAGKPFPGRGLVRLPELTSDVEHGAQIYSQQCSVCHGKEGGGNGPMLPPLWGPGAYNEGAGINGIAKMAAFVQHNMPQNKPGSLSAQDAFDVAAYIRSKPHPSFNQAYKIY
jgi:thiosulfate dehydrogenase